MVIQKTKFSYVTEFVFSGHSDFLFGDLPGQSTGVRDAEGTLTVKRTE
jgi:hypothetical protein